MNPLFVLDDSVFEAISRDDAFQCAQDLKEAGLRALPAPAIDVKIRIGVLDPEWRHRRDCFIFTVTQRGQDDYALHVDPAAKRIYFTAPNYFQWLVRESMWRLWASLSARNVVKDVCVRPHGRKTKYGQPKHTHVTTIRAPKVLYESSGAGSGAAVRPHFRRGHIREQPFGQGRQGRKRIWIEPLFINGDSEYVGAPKTYKVVA